MSACWFHVVLIGNLRVQVCFLGPCIFVLIVWSQHTVVCISHGFQRLRCAGNGLYSLSCGVPVIANHELRVNFNSFGALCVGIQNMQALW